MCSAAARERARSHRQQRLLRPGEVGRRRRHGAGISGDQRRLHPLAAPGGHRCGGGRGFPPLLALRLPDGSLCGGRRARGGRRLLAERLSVCSGPGRAAPPRPAQPRARSSRRGRAPPAGSRPARSQPPPPLAEEAPRGGGAEGGGGGGAAMMGRSHEARQDPGGGGGGAAGAPARGRGRRERTEAWGGQGAVRGALLPQVRRNISSKRTQNITRGEKKAAKKPSSIHH